jgi:signal transduction histidine kinase
VERMTSLVADMVEINLGEDDPLLKGLQPADLGAIVSEVTTACTMEAEARNCRLEVEGRMESILEGSPELLRRAVENVLRNAIRYAPEGTPIYLTLDADEQQATITIRDLGPGVPEEMLTQIFDPFFRVEEARDRRCPGSCSGLGLSIARRAVQLHHGTIAAENAGPGLRVRITLPLPAAAVPA